MAFIRSTSNPEKLYIFGSITGLMEFYAGDQVSHSCDCDRFIEFMRRYIENRDRTLMDEEKFSYDNISIEEEETEFKMKLTVDDWSILMYSVTWEQLVYSFRWHIGFGFNFFQKIKWVIQNWWAIGRIGI